MPASRDDDASRFTQKSGSEPARARIDNQQVDLNKEPQAQKAESEAGRAAAIDEVGATEAAFHKAIGLDKVPLKGSVEFTAKRVEMEAQRAEGVSRAQNVRFSNERGENLSGLQYTYEGATYLKTSSGQKFSVNAEPAGGFVLTAASWRFDAVKLTVLPDLFGASSENQILSARSIKEADVAQAKEGQSASLTGKWEQAMLVVKEAGLIQAAGGVGQDSQSLKEDRSSKIIPVEEKLDQGKQVSDAASLAGTDKSAETPAARLASSLDIISSAIADLSAVDNPVLRDLAAKIELGAMAPPARPISFDLADIVEPVVSPARPIPEGDSEIEEDDGAGGQIKETSVPSSEDKEEEDEAVALAQEEELVESQQEIVKPKQERRRRYVVKDKDTLSSIAAKQLRDRRLGELLFEINRHLIPVKVIRGRSVRQLKPRMVIYLPTTAEIDEFRGRFVSPTADSTDDFQEAEENEFVQESASDLSATAIGGFKSDQGEDKPESKETGPNPNRQSYTVRLGDTLKSVAMKHPALSDLGLWQLLAEVNGLSTEVDGRGQPLARLVRGNRLFIPESSEIEQFRISRQAKNNG